jgi:hypothetical protein
MAMNVTLSRDEVGRIFRIAPQTVDRLIVDGRLLCTIADGEPRVPLEQLEHFLRDSLLRLYQTEAWLETRSEESVGAILSATRTPAAVRDEASQAGVIVSTNTATSTVTDDDDARVIADAIAMTEVRRATGMTQDVTQDGDDAGVIVRTVAPTLHERPTLRPGSAIAPPSPPPSDAEQEQLYAEQRISPRYIPNRQIDGIYDDVKFTIVQISGSGMRIRHTEPLAPGREAKLSFALLNQAQSFAVRARVVWTSAARYEGADGENFYISGLRVTAHSERLARAIEMLQAEHELRPERRVQQDRRSTRPSFPPPPSPPSSSPPVSSEDSELVGVADDDVALVIEAVQRFANDPETANRWYGRGRFALADEQVRREAPPRPRDREEVLAVWEFLERRVELPKVGEIVAWLRERRGGSTVAPP